MPMRMTMDAPPPTAGTAARSGEAKTTSLMGRTRLAPRPPTRQSLSALRHLQRRELDDPGGSSMAHEGPSRGPRAAPAREARSLRGGSSVPTFLGMGALANDAAPPAASPVRFEAHPDGYRHWRLELPPELGGRVAKLVLDVREGEGLRPGYALKLNSYDLGVDIELADAIRRIRFEHPDVKAVLVASGKDRVFSSGANIYMLAASGHQFKVNFCKFTNETRLELEELSAETGVPSLAALAGTASGGGYELAIACDEVVLLDDGSSAVSFPEAPLLGVLPGTGGLTRLVDKRRIRRDLADVFSTVAEGV